MEINYLKQLFNSLSGGKGDVAPIPMGLPLTEDEMNQLRIVLNRFPGLNKDVEKIMNDLKNLNLGDLKDRMKDFEEMLKKKADKTELGPIWEEIDRIKEILDGLLKELESIKNGMDGLGHTGETGVTKDHLGEINARLHKMEL